MKEEKVINFDSKYLGSFPIPRGYSKYAEEINNCCGELAIAGLLNISVPKVFEKTGVKITDLVKGTSQKRMREILDKLGFNAKQRGVKNKFRLPKSDLAIVRVSFGDPKQHWIETAKKSHYLALKRFGLIYYVLDNMKIDDKYKWVERIEYSKVIEADKMFITSYLEVKPKEVF